MKNIPITAYGDPPSVRSQGSMAAAAGAPTCMAARIQPILASERAERPRLGPDQTGEDAGGRMVQPAPTLSAARRKPQALYASLEERVLARDQVGASKVYYELLRAGRPLPEMLGEAVRIHAPYTHVPYHERIDDGFVNFVNNDHCLLSARAATQLSRMVPEDCAALPLAQTIWYIPTGLDIWNQKILKAPGHYARAPGWSMPPGPPPMPEVAWADQEPELLDGPLQEGLGPWLAPGQRGHV